MAKVSFWLYAATAIMMLFLGVFVGVHGHESVSGVALDGCLDAMVEEASGQSDEPTHCLRDVKIYGNRLIQLTDPDRPAVFAFNFPPCPEAAPDAE